MFQTQPSLIVVFNMKDSANRNIWNDNNWGNRVEDTTLDVQHSSILPSDVNSIMKCLKVEDVSIKGE